MKLIFSLLLLFGVSSVFANNGVDHGAMDGNMWGSIAMFVGLFVVMYFLTIRPQSKKAKEHRELVNNLKIGNEIITNSGFLGKIYKIKGQFIVLMLSENVEVIIQKHAIVNILPNGTFKEFK